jgi:hypothetical protein
MAYEKRDMSGSLFKNKKPLGEKSANLTGSVLIGGVEYWANAWVKTDKNGDKWISLSFKHKDAPRQEVKAQPTTYDLEDDIPF